MSDKAQTGRDEVCPSVRVVGAAGGDNDRLWGCVDGDQCLYDQPKLLSVTTFSQRWYTFRGDRG